MVSKAIRASQKLVMPQLLNTVRKINSNLLSKYNIPMMK